MRLKTIFAILFLIIATVAIATAQEYPLPSTRIYGNLTVDDTTTTTTGPVSFITGASNDVIFRTTGTTVETGVTTGDDTASVFLTQGVASIYGLTSSTFGQIGSISRIRGSLLYADGNQAAGAILTSDAQGYGSWQLPSYGEMGFGDSLRTVQLTQNVPAWVTNSGNDLWSVGATNNTSDVVYDGDSLVVTTAGDYQVQIQLTMSGSTGSTIELQLYKNGAEDCTCVSATSLLNNRTISLSYTDITDVAENDVFKVYVENTATNDDIGAINGKIIMVRVK